MTEREVIIAESRIKSGDVAVLELIRASELPPSQKELGEALGMTQPGIAYRLAKLHRAGLIEWVRGRARGILVTPKGRRWKELP